MFDLLISKLYFIANIIPGLTGLHVDKSWAKMNTRFAESSENVYHDTVTVHILPKKLQHQSFNEK